MSARSKSVWHVCAWPGCRRRFRPYGGNNVYCCHSHYSLARRRRPAIRYCALPACGRAFSVGGSLRNGRRRPDEAQRFHTKRCASVARERARHSDIAVPTLTAVRRAALASALDGEGWVSKSNWILEIGNTDREWLSSLRRRAGQVGTIRFERRRQPRWQHMWRWRVYGVNAYALLAQCLPDLIVKRARAQAFTRRYRASHPLI